MHWNQRPDQESDISTTTPVIVLHLLRREDMISVWFSVDAKAVCYVASLQHCQSCILSHFTTQIPTIINNKQTTPSHTHVCTTNPHPTPTCAPPYTHVCTTNLTLHPHVNTHPIHQPSPYTHHPLLHVYRGVSCTTCSKFTGSLMKRLHP